MWGLRDIQTVVKFDVIQKKLWSAVELVQREVMQSDAEQCRSC